MDEVERIAGKLTKDEREALVRARLRQPTKLSKPGTHYMTFPCREVKAGMVTKCLISCRGTLLRRGLSIRAHLLGDTNG